MNKLFAGVLGLFLFISSSVFVWAGGSGLNVVVVVNQASTNSVQLGNYYRQMRNVPPQNFLRINWPITSASSAKDWLLTDFTNVLLNPLLTMLSSRQLTNQIDYIVLSMDIPYRVGNGATVSNSTTSALFYGFKSDTTPNGDCGFAPNSTNLYTGSESIFRSTPPVSGASNFWMVTMITSDSLANAKMTVTQGVSSDGTFPAQTVFLGTSVDTSRNVRYSEFDNTVFDARLRGNYTVMRTNIFSPFFDSVILGYQNGDFGFTPGPIPLFVPGAMADNLTSFGGQLFDNSGQTTALAFIDAGASGSYGTVDEPCAFLEKFPNSQNYFYQARGFSLGECYYQSITNPYQGLVLGEPLAAPFAQPGGGAWSGLTSNSVISGTTNLSVQFTASDAAHPLQQLDLFLDGSFLQTVTNIVPQSSNTLNVSLNGFFASYTVPASATIKSITTGLVSLLNSATFQNNTKVAATAHGDRVELQSTAAYAKTGSQISLTVGSSTSSGSLNTFLRAGPADTNTFLDTIAEGINAYEVGGTLLANGTFTATITKTNGAVTAVTVTNNSGTVAALAQQLISAINASTSLQAPDGVTANDLVQNATGSLATFNIQANTPGYAAAQLKAAVSGSIGLFVTPSGTSTLTQNVNDLRPRNHLYVTAGVTNLSAAIPLNTTSLADGYHELAAVAYEGSHVRTQTRATQNVIIKNNALSATLTPTLTGTNSMLEPTLQFTVTANTNNISSIQLFTTGGFLDSVIGQSSATFSITLSNLDVGVHPFYAIVTDTSSHQYRTATYDLGIVGVDFSGVSLLGVDTSFPLQLTGPAPTFVFPATAGRAYDILATTNLAQPFQLHATVTPTTSLGQYTETNLTAAQQFYRIRATP